MPDLGPPGPLACPPVGAPTVVPAAGAPATGSLERLRLLMEAAVTLRGIEDETAAEEQHHARAAAATRLDATIEELPAVERLARTLAAFSADLDAPRVQLPVPDVSGRPGLWNRLRGQLRPPHWTAGHVLVSVQEPSGPGRLGGETYAWPESVLVLAADGALWTVHQPLLEVDPRRPRTRHVVVGASQDEHERLRSGFHSLRTLTAGYPDVRTNPPRPYDVRAVEQTGITPAMVSSAVEALLQARVATVERRRTRLGR